MLDLAELGKMVALRRKTLRMTQAALALRAKVGRTAIDGLENGRARELGFTKVSRILSALDMGLRLVESPKGRPTLEDLLKDNDD
jgi:transcriptional regulator with XRE-family HTH domain